MANVADIALKNADTDHRTGKPVHNAIWSLPDARTLQDQPVGAGKGAYHSGQSDFLNSDRNSICLRFEVSHAEQMPDKQQEQYCVASEVFDWQEDQALLRLDQVTFPSGAIAYRHIHAGAGFRHLVVGKLLIEADKHSQNMQAGDSWFEDRCSPVTATAVGSGFTQFVRAMVIPAEFAGKPTIQILDPEDVEKPTLQKNYRFIDQPIRM